MKRIISLLLTCFFFACQNPGDKNKTAGLETGKDTAVNEQTYIALGGQEQYVEITGASSKNPVLLFLHGGPGWPQTPHLRYFNADLTRSVTLAAWEQAGCGKSYMRNPNPKNLSVAQLINDAHELTQILKKKFHQDKIYLAGFSWGSVIGLQLANKYPEDYIAYFGISQVIDINRSIALSRAWLKEQAVLKGDKKMLQQVAQLERMDTSLCRSTLECFFKKYEFLTEYGGAIHNKAAEAEITIAETKYEDYKNYDWMKGFMYSCGRLGDAVFETNLTGITALKVPAFFFVGRYDRSIPPIITEEFVAKLKAPAKEIVWFENSGHEPLEEEAALFNKKMAERVTAK
jgi:pimeloyl-ACP methyl ester carboxylesterase